MKKQFTNKLIIVSAPSGAGKTTLVKHVLENISDIEFSVSCATRKARPKEIDGKDYYFISVKEFKQKIKNNEFAEWEEVYKSSFYGTLKSEIERIWKKGKAVIFDIDVIGGINLKNLYPDNSMSVFIMPPSVEILEERLRNRQTESEEKLKQRIEKAEKEIGLSDKFDRIIINDQLDISKAEIENCINDFLAEK